MLRSKNALFGENRMSAFTALSIIACVILSTTMLTGGADAASNPIGDSPKVIGWQDSFDDYSKVSEVGNVSMKSGGVYLNDTFNGLSWTKRGMVLDNGGTYDTTHAFNPTVIFHDGEYKMWYSGIDQGGDSTYRILYANSSDGENWTKQGLAIDVGGSNATDHVASPHVLFEGGGIQDVVLRL